MTILVLKPMVLRIPHCKKPPYGALWGVNLANPIIWRGHCLFVFSCYIMLYTKTLLIGYEMRIMWGYADWCIRKYDDYGMPMYIPA